MDSHYFAVSMRFWFAGIVLSQVTGCASTPSSPAAHPVTAPNGSQAANVPTETSSSQPVQATAYQPSLHTNPNFFARIPTFDPALTQELVASPSIEQATAPDLESDQSTKVEPEPKTESQSSAQSESDSDSESESEANSNRDQNDQASVEHFIAVALSNHPKVLAARQKVAAAANVPVQAKALPDPMFSNTFWPIHDAALQTAGGRIGNQMNLTQQVPWPQKLGARAEIASQEIRMAEAELYAAEKEVVESVRLAYYELWYASQGIRIIDDVAALVDDLLEVTEAKYIAGGSQQDVLRAQLEADRLDDQLITLRKQRSQTIADLATLLRQPVEFIPEPTTKLQDVTAIDRLESYLASAEQFNPELQGLAAEIQRDRSRERLACLQQYPDLTFGVHWGIISDADAISPVADGNDNFNFTVGTTLPIWRDKIDGGIREAAHRRASTVQRYESQRDLLTGKIRRLIAQVDALVEQKQLYQDRILPRTRDTLELTITDYRGQRTDFLSVIDSYRELLMIELQLARLDASIASTLAQIDRAVGSN